MIYLDNAATSFPKPECVLSAMNSCIKYYCGNPGRSGHKMSMRTAEEIFKARSEISKLIRAQNGERIIFTNNATESLNLAIKGVLCEGDHVVTTAMEHNSVLRPLKDMEKHGVEISVVACREDGSLCPLDVEKSIRQNTRLIVCTLASNVTGTIMPVESIGKLARQNNILFLLDASQGLGALDVDVDVLNVDLMAAPGHKGLLGPQGTGILYVREGVMIKPLKQGGTGTYSQLLEQPSEFPDGYESGTLNAPGIIGLGASVSFINRIGPQRIREKEKKLTEELEGELCDMKNIILYGPINHAKRMGIVTFNVKNKVCEEIASTLSDEYGIAVRAGYHCAPLAHKTIGTTDTGAVRASIGPFTTPRDISRTINAIYQIQKGL